MSFYHLTYALSLWFFFFFSTVNERVGDLGMQKSDPSSLPAVRVDRGFENRGAWDLLGSKGKVSFLWASILCLLLLLLFRARALLLLLLFLAYL